MLVIVIKYRDNRKEKNIPLFCRSIIIGLIFSVKMSTTIFKSNFGGLLSFFGESASTKYIFLKCFIA